MGITILRAADRREVVQAEFSGRISEEDLVNFFISIQSDRELRTAPALLCDCSPVEAVALPAGALERIALQCRSNRQEIALVASTGSLSFGLARAFASVASRSDRSVMVFERSASALEWLLAKIDRKARDDGA